MQAVKIGDWRGTNAGNFDPAAISDLRRKFESSAIDLLLARAEALPAPDLALLRAIYADNRSASEIASLVHDDPRKLRVRVRALTKRIMTPIYAFVVAHNHTWPESRRRVGIACFIQGHSQRDAAVALHTSLHAVRRHCQAIQDLFAAHTRPGEVAA